MLARKHKSLLAMMAVSLSVACGGGKPGATVHAAQDADLPHEIHADAPAAQDLDVVKDNRIDAHTAPDAGAELDVKAADAKKCDAKSAWFACDDLKEWTVDTCDAMGECVHTSSQFCNWGHECKSGCHVVECVDHKCVVSSAFEPGKSCGASFDPCVNYVCTATGACVGLVMTGQKCLVGGGGCTMQGSCDSDAVCQLKPQDSCLVPPSPCLLGSCSLQGQCEVSKVLAGAPCPAPSACYKATCDAKGFCQPSALALGTPCGSTDPCHGPGACDGMGKCVTPVLQGKLCPDQWHPCADVRCTTSGKCAPVLSAPLVGKQCADSGEPCRALVCDAQAKCVVASKPGAPCTIDEPCLKPQGTCDTSGKCVGTVSVGAACTAGECFGPGTCSAAGACVGPAKVGQPCGAKNLCNELNSQTCQPDGKCLGKPKPDGTPCGPPGGCVEGSACQGGECVLGLESTCLVDKVCQEAKCCVGAALADPACKGKAGSCVTKPLLGVGCYDSSECGELVCAAGGCELFTDLCPLQNSACNKSSCKFDGAKAPVKCQPSVSACDDQTPCTKDACVPGQGCSFAPVSDGVTCGNERLCKTGQCVLP